MDRPYTTAILAGGNNTRFDGKNKALICFDGQPVFERIFSAAKSEQNIIISNHPNAEKLYSSSKFSPTIYNDIHKNKGPLAGIHAALHYAEYDPVLIMPCDLPLMNTKTVELLFKYFQPSFDAIIPCINGHTHPVSALYRKKVKETAENMLSDNNPFSIHALLDNLHILYLVMPEWAEHAFLNMNSLKEYHLINKILGNENKQTDKQDY